MQSKTRLIQDGHSARGKIPGVRYLQSFLLFLCLFSAYLLRVSISVAIVAMTPDKDSTDFIAETHYHIPVFEWTPRTKNLILSAFFWGYLIMNLPAAMIGRRYNNQTLLAMSMTLTVALSIVTPTLVVAFDWPVLVLIRFLQGITQAFTMPMIHGISAKWAPPNERGRLVGFVLGGLQFGTVVTLVGSGILASTRSGWPSIYYVSGAFGIVWVALWLSLGSESPDTHRLITQSEKNYIKSSLTQTISDRKNLITPWKEIFTSMPVWAITVSHAGHNCGFWLLLSEMPMYISSVLKFDIKSDGFVSALPYLAMWLCQFPVTCFADHLNKKNVTSITFSRKFWNTIGMCGGALGLVTLGYMGANANAAICLYVFVVAIGCCTNVGFNINHLDLAPNYAGILMGFTNAVASLGGVLAPTVCGFIVHDQSSVDEWRVVFSLGAVILFFSSMFYIVFGSAEVQPWNEPKNENDEYTDLDIIANAVVMFSAGAEPVSITTALCLYELAVNEDIQNKLRAEVISARRKHEGKITSDFLSELQFADMVLNETFRKYSIAIAIMREATQDYHVPGGESLLIEKGQKIVLPMYSVHHDPKYYPDPSTFDPERFSAEEKSKRPAGTFFPFSVGPRQCIAKRFAEMEIKLVLSEILSKFELFPCEKTDIPLKMKIGPGLLTPKNGVWLSFKPISK